MKLDTVGQRCSSEPEPELGLGIVFRVENYRIWVNFPAVGEQRLYAKDTSAIKRVSFREGESISNHSGLRITIESVTEEDGLLTYVGKEGKIREDEVSDIEDFSAPQDRFMKAQVDTCEVFNLRYRSLLNRSEYRKSPLRGLMGGRVELIPHQFYILSEVASRQNPRVLLADEVGLGKTIEACLILQRLLSLGKVSRVLILVPDALVNQWFVELLRRFNYWFSIYDEERCRELEKQDVDGNPFLDEQLVLCSMDYLASSEVRSEQASEAGWDMVVIDEAHHLEWSETHASKEYLLAEALAKSTQSLLLLTATPTQLGMEGHFARLRLLDPARYSDYPAFLEEAKHYAFIAATAAKIIDGEPLHADNKELLNRLYEKNPERLEELLKGIETRQPGAEVTLLRTLLDEYGTGRVIFRNTRENMKGFPKRIYHPVPLEDNGESNIHDRIHKELAVDASGNESEIRYLFAKDPRLLWLIRFLKDDPSRKVLLICRTLRKAAAIKHVLDHESIRFGMFHEELTLLQRDRNAAWFAEEDGAQLLVCSEIGSEGRNFQFAHHLVLFDLPLDPGLLEQRIGRLDRIGQKETIHIHMPYVEGSAYELIANWYQQGLDAFEHPLKGGDEYTHRFGEELLELALNYKLNSKKFGKAQLEAFIEETVDFRTKLEKRLHEGRDRLLELNSFNPEKAARLIAEISTAEKQETSKALLFDLLEFYGIKISDYESGECFLDPEHAFLEAFPSIPKDGMFACFDRMRAVNREDISFITQDHPLFKDAMETLIASPTGTSAFATMISEEVNMLLECVFVVEAVAEAKWQVEQFLSPTPVRVVVDIRGRNRSEDMSLETIQDNLKDGNIHRFLEQPMFNYDILKNLIAGALRYAERRAEKVTSEASRNAEDSLGYELKRLVDLQKMNNHVRDEEIESLQSRIEHTSEAIKEARLRLDGIRVLMIGPEAALKNVVE